MSSRSESSSSIRSRKGEDGSSVEAFDERKAILSGDPFELARAWHFHIERDFRSRRNVYPAQGLPPGGAFPTDKTTYLRTMWSCSLLHHKGVESLQ